MRKLTTHTSWLEYESVLAAREPFTTSGALRGVASPIYETSGRLPVEHLDSFLNADYAVYSYDTPIAWHRETGGWEVPFVGYSRTTTRHQNKIRTALQHANVWSE